MSTVRQTQWKREAAIAAVRAEVRSGMVVGLGTGTTALFVLDELARRIREEGLEVRGVPTSLQTELFARGRRIPLTDLAEIPDVNIDGADEVDSRRNLTKGGGGAMTREKCVAVATRRLVIVVDTSKLVRRLSWPVPVEVLPFAVKLVERELAGCLPGCQPVLRKREGTTFVTDSGNYILDVHFAEQRPAPARLNRTLNSITGVVEHGLFVGMEPAVYSAGENGVSVLERSSRRSPRCAPG